jgi:hypothetical protein
MKPLIIILAIAGAFLVGAAFNRSHPLPTFPSEWKQLQLPPEPPQDDELGLVSATIEAYSILGRFSVSMLELASASGEGKFLSGTPFEPDARPLAYKINLSARPYVQMKDEPLAYPDRIMKPDEVVGGYYDFAFEFTLRDREGFPLATLATERDMQPENLKSGATKTFLGVTTNAVSPYVAAATHSIDLSVTVVRGRPEIKDE